jgi:hypothetical protein
MWLIVDLALVALGLVLVALLGLHAYGRFRRMNRFGSRAGRRLATLAEEAGRLGERVDVLAERSEAAAVATRR